MVDTDVESFSTFKFIQMHLFESNRNCSTPSTTLWSLTSVSSPVSDSAAVERPLISAVLRLKLWPFSSAWKRGEDRWLQTYGVNQEVASSNRVMVTDQSFLFFSFFHNDGWTAKHVNTIMDNQIRLEGWGNGEER